MKFRLLLFLFLLLHPFAYSDEPHQIQIRVIVDEFMIENGLKEDIKGWLHFTQSYFLNEAEIPIQFSPIQAFLFPQEYRGNWHHHRVAAIMQELADKFRQQNEALLFIINSTHDGGRSKDALGISLVGFNHQESKQKQFDPRLLIIHELSHLFGTLDLVQKNNILDEDELHEALRKMESSITFDKTSLAIMKKAYQYIAKQKQNYFSIYDIDLKTGEILIPLYMSLLDDARDPHGIHSIIGAFYLNQQQYEKALDYYEKTTKLMTEKPESGFKNVAYDLILYNKGLCYFYLQRNQEAIDILHRSLEEGPPDSNKYLYLGAAYQGLYNTNGDWSNDNIESVSNLFKRSAELNPNSAWAWAKLARVSLLAVPTDEWNSERMQEITSYLQHCLDADPEHPYGLHYMGIILQQQGSNEQALPFLKRARQVGVNRLLPMRKQDGLVYTKQ